MCWLPFWASNSQATTPSHSQVSGIIWRLSEPRANLDWQVQVHPLLRLTLLAVYSYIKSCRRAPKSSVDSSALRTSITDRIHCRTASSHPSNRKHAAHSIAFALASFSCCSSSSCPRASCRYSHSRQVYRQASEPEPADYPPNCSEGPQERPGPCIPVRQLRWVRC